ncbi:ejaculatory bulb-specific protein 3-like [Bacillus rossius redtenbacheri]|uniref:ejaculatory bulb-specific protein 3-like n=1 Tax=Bacillus rossius redtenbacheri TaxID=93214 RepID=UPI002FDE540E
MTAAGTLLAACLLAACLMASAEDKYPDRYDNMSVEEVLDNERAYRRYLDCLLDRGVCPPAGKDLKEHIRDAMSSKCSMCTDAQKEKLHKAFLYMEEKKADDLQTLLDHYGTDKKMRDDFIKFVKSIKSTD